LTHLAGRIVLVNARTEKLFGFQREELTGQAAEIPVPERFRGRNRGHRASFMSHPQVREVEVDDEYCSRNPEAHLGRHVMLAVSDTGCGMSPEVLARIFEPFFTTKEQGTGLGLATIYGIVKQSGGHINAYSEAGRGATFKIYLPATQEEVGKREAITVEKIAPRGAETILVVEDEESLRTITREYLSNKGHTVIAAEDFERALEVAQDDSLHVDLLMTDVVLPGSSGPKLADRLAANRPNMKVLFVSGYTADALVHGDLHRDDFAFLSKPFSLNTLARKIRSVLDE
jgi:two-component system, cell cycle sensor histidine kinase and response regulator CckA